MIFTNVPSEVPGGEYTRFLVRLVHLILWAGMGSCTTRVSLVLWWLARPLGGNSSSHQQQDPAQYNTIFSSSHLPDTLGTPTPMAVFWHAVEGNLLLWPSPSPRLCFHHSVVPPLPPSLPPAVTWTFVGSDANTAFNFFAANRVAGNVAAVNFLYLRERQHLNLLTASFISFFVLCNPCNLV